MKNLRGYTLVELIVSVAVFALVMTLATGAYFVTISIDQAAQANSKAVNNLSFALDSMTRAIRAGTAYKCNNSTNDCTSGTFSFTDTNGNAVTYALTSTNGNGAIMETEGGSTFPITDPSVNITTLKFNMTGAGLHDTLQPHLTLVVTGTIVTPHSGLQSFTIETGATMRTIDI